MASLYIWKLPWNYTACASVWLTHIVNSHTDESLSPVQLQIYQELNNFSSKTWQTLCVLLSIFTKFPEITLNCIYWHRHISLRWNDFLSFFYFSHSKTSFLNQKLIEQFQCQHPCLASHQRHSYILANALYKPTMPWIQEICQLLLPCPLRKRSLHKLGSKLSRLRLYRHLNRCRKSVLLNSTSI